MATNKNVRTHSNPFGIMQDIHNNRRNKVNNNGIYNKAQKETQQTTDELFTVQAGARKNGLEKISIIDLIGKLRSSNHFSVLQALDELRSRGKLSDGTLSWACLKYVKFYGANLSSILLENADLEKSDFQKANLSSANLKNARLVRANLESSNTNNASFEGANLIGANLSGAENCSYDQFALAGKMRGAILPDGRRYDGRLNLPGDLADALILHVDLSDPSEIASFYGIPVEDFIHGQEWSNANMPGVSTWHQSINFQIAELRMQWL